MKPEEVKQLPAARACLFATGLDAIQMDKPLVGIVFSQNDVCPGHLRLVELADFAAKGVIEAGGTPIKMNVGLGICDGIAMGHDGMRYSLPSRDLNADTVEDMVLAHGCFSGLILIGACDKNLPGYLMAAARLNMPTIFITPGPMMPGFASGRALDVVDAFAADAQHALGKMNGADYRQVIECSCPGPGSCAGLFTACSMACVTEALGMSVPEMATTHAVDVKKLRLCVRTGREIMNLIKDGITARDIMTEGAFANALAVDMAIGASTNTVLHIPAIAREAGVEITLDMIDAISQKTPNLVKISPSSTFKMFDFDRAGGVPTVMKELQSLLKINQATVEGNVDARIEFARPADGNVIRTFDKPYSPTGGIMVLKGNLAPGGSVMKASGVDSGVKEFTGQAAVFENEEAATAFIKSGQLKPGTVLVIKNEGPAGGPGMREMLYPTSAVRGLKMDKEVALITDGRFSGGTAGVCIGHVEPEAFNAGPIAAVKNGDKIVIDLVAKTVTLCVEEQEIRRRLQWLPAAKELPKGGILEKFRKVYRNCKA